MNGTLRRMMRHGRPQPPAAPPAGWPGATYNVVTQYGADNTGATDAATAINNALTAAKNAGGGTVYLPAGQYYYNGTPTVPDGVRLLGDGIWNQGISGGDGGTWLRAKGGMRWGSHVKVEKLLVGSNVAGATCYFRPVARGTSTAGADTETNGSHNVTFSFVRFKGGSDAGIPLLDLSGNHSSLWSDSLKTIDMVGTTWNDCEFERPQSTNSVNGTSLGATLNLWWDARSGGAELHDLAWNRCHFGVRNGYKTGVDGYGIGRTLLFQPAPSEHATDGPRPNSGGVGDGTNGWNPDFDWADVTHTAHDIAFTDCLMEYSNWYPLNVCDYARSYSVWKGNETGLPGTLTTPLTPTQNLATGWGNPPGNQWTSIPTVAWIDVVGVTRCYFKGSYPSGYSEVFELARSATVLDSYTGTGSFSLHPGSYGNSRSGSFSNAARPRTALFDRDWSGATTSYTASPYDPA